ncbi:hypothetical protein AX15_006331 [Amanita polypyramis BW_CC]|nr:hypothetical protein AX15_006331 [Amanita polypyramis BW_CC]
MPLSAHIRPGSRIDYAGYHGSVKYIGEVANTSGSWLGIEWDDPQRGKHDGVKDGIRYFQCLVPGAGSFIRPSAKTSLGVTFLNALSSKYIEIPHGSESQETVILGSSNGSIQVEAVDLNKIRRKLSDLGQLREVSLDKENVSDSDPPDAILRTCPNIRGLDLSNCLIPSWNVVACITSQLPVLERLSVNRTRLSLPIDVNQLNGAFPSLVELQLNHTMLSWSDMTRVVSMMPRLEVVEMGCNQLSQLHANDNLIGMSTIRSVNLDGNSCCDWVHVCDRLGMYPSLERIVLTSNGLETIPSLTVSKLVCVKHLALSFNRLRSWRDIDALASWCPSLETLTIAGNPLAIEMERFLRPFTIAKISSLKALDGSMISHKEREDSELFYLSHITQIKSKTQDELAHEHPRWGELRLKHGQTENNPNTRGTQGKLKDYIIGGSILHSKQDSLSAPCTALNIYLTSAEIEETFPFESSKCITLNVIPSMTLRTLRAKISRSVRGRTSKGKVRLWQRMQNDFLAELDNDRDTQNLSWIGLEDGTSIVCRFQDG